MISKKLSLLSVLIAASLLVSNAFASQGATDPIPGTSKGTVSTGGGGGGGGGGTATGGGRKTVAPTPAPTPIVLPPAPPPAPFVAVTLTFTAANPVNGVAPVCSGDYHIDPYYPTLSLMTVNVDMTGVNAPTGTTYYVNVSGTGGTLYPFTSNIIYTTGGTGLATYSVYVTPGTSVTGVNITDSSGVLIATGI